MALSSSKQAWNTDETLALAYCILATLWAPTGGVGLLSQRRWGWRLAISYFGFILLSVVAVELFAPRANPQWFFVSTFAASFIALVLLFLPAVRMHLAADADASRGV